jgi:membrane fusion protein, multidrug efflux system
VVINANEAVAKARVDSADAALLSAKFALADTAVWARSSPTAKRASANTSRPARACSRSSRWRIFGWRPIIARRRSAAWPHRCRYLSRQADRRLRRSNLAGRGAGICADFSSNNATGNFKKIVRRFTLRIRFNRRDANATLARPGMSVETAVAVSTPDNASPDGTRRSDRLRVRSTSKDMVERTLTKPGASWIGPRSSSGHPGHRDSGTADTLKPNQTLRRDFRRRCANVGFR